MKRSLRAEALKLFTTRGTYGLLLGAVLVVMLTVFSSIGDAVTINQIAALNDHVVFLLSSINVGLFSLILGMRAVTDEYRNGTIAHAFLSDPGRNRTVVAKAAAAAVAAAVIALMSLLGLVALSFPLAAAKGASLTLGDSDTSAFIGFVVANALWAVIGVGVGALIRQQVATVVVGLVWVLVIENLGAGFLGDASAYLPGQAAYAFTRALDNANGLDPSTGGVVFAAYALAFTSIGMAATRLRDVA